MNIILLILKIIGMILLVILGIVLLILGCVLFVPVRYSVAGIVKDGKMEGTARITYLLHLVSIQILYSKKDGPGMLLKIAGFRLKAFGSLEKRPEKSEKQVFQNATPEDDTAASEEIREEKTPVKEIASPTEEEIPVKEIAAPTEEKPSVREITSPTEEKSSEKERVSPIEEKLSAKETVRLKEKHFSIGEKISGITEKLSSILEKLSSILEKLSSIPEKLWELIDMVFSFLGNANDDFSQKTEEIADRLEKTKKKFGKFVNDNNKEVLKLVWRRGLVLLRHYKPRKIKGYLKYGTGRPDLTAEAGGFLYMVLPAGADRYSIEPVWDRAFIETDTALTGHIRVCHLAAAGIRLLLSKNFRKLIFGGRRKKRK